MTNISIPEHMPNIALGMPANQTSTGISKSGLRLQAGFAVDGDNTNQIDSGSCSQTGWFHTICPSLHSSLGILLLEDELIVIMVQFPPYYLNLYYLKVWVIQKASRGIILLFYEYVQFHSISVT